MIRRTRPTLEIVVDSFTKSPRFCMSRVVWYGRMALTTARIWSSFSLKNVARKSENVTSSGIAVRSDANASEAARSRPRSARKPRNVSDTTRRSDQDGFLRGAAVLMAGSKGI